MSPSQSGALGRAFCTVATPGRRGYAEVLLEDLGVTHPGMTAFVLWAADQPPTSPLLLGERVTALSLADVGLVGRDLEKLREGALSDDEYLTALRPWLLQRVLDGGLSSVLFLADDLHVTASLEALFDRAEAAGAAFVRRSPPLERSTEANLSAGVEHPAVDVDLLAVAPGGERLLGEWKAAYLHGSEQPSFRSADFLDRAAGLFPGAVLDAAGFNLGWWNLQPAGRSREGQDELPGAVGPALHLHGFDAWRPHLITAEVDRPLPLCLSDVPWLAAVCSRYAERVRRAAGGGGGPYPEGIGEAEPGRLWEDRFAAASWERSCRAAGTGRWPHPPGGTRSETARATAWLNSPPEGSSVLVSRYLMEVYRARPDLQLAFPDLGADPRPFLRWARVHGRRELGIPSALLPARHPAPLPRTGRGGSRNAQASHPGVNVIGLLGTHLGLGEAARQLLAALDAAGVPTRVWEYDTSESPRLQGGPTALPRGPWYAVNLLCLNPPELRHFQEHLGRSLIRNRHNIGIWAWETETAPRSWLRSAELVDEVWAPSRFVQESLRPAATLPVRLLPHAVGVPEHPPYMDRAYLGLPEGFLFLFMFDFNSSIRRKNAVGLVRAFRSAFASSEGPKLVIKTINGQSHQGDFEELLLAAAGREDILLYDRVLSPEERAALLDACDCYVSLHRAEGFGLTLAEAMALGKPVIATAYSGNLDFMTPENSYLVGAKRARVGVSWDRYPPGHFWAEPDLAEAGRTMRSVWMDPEPARERGARARSDVAQRLSPEVVGQLVRRRLEEVWASLPRSGVQAPPLLATARRLGAEAARRLGARVIR